MPGSLDTHLAHDVVLTGSDGTVIGLMLTKPIDDEGVPQAKRWALSEVEIPAGVRVSEVGLNQSDLAPDTAASVFRESNTGGMGLPIIVTGANNYMSGLVQTGVLNKIILPPAVTEIALPTSEGDVQAWGQFNGAVYVTDGRYLHRSTNGTSFSQVLDIGAGKEITDLKAFGASDGDTGLVVATQDGTTEDAEEYYWSTDGTSFSQTSPGPTRDFHRFIVVEDTLYGLENANVFRTTTDPFAMAAVWGTATDVGDQLGHFHGGVSIGGLVLFFKSDRVFIVDSSGTVSTLMGQFAHDPGHHNFGAHAVGMNMAAYTTVGNELWEYDTVDGGMRKIGLADLIDTQYDATSDSHEEGVAFDGDALYVLHRTSMEFAHATFPMGPNPSVVRVTQDTTGVFVFERWALETPTSLLTVRGPFYATRTFKSLTTARHLFFNTATAGKVARMDLPRAADPTLDSGSRYAPIGVYRSGWMTHSFPTQPKDYIDVLVDVQGLETGVTLDVYYYLNGDLSTRRTLETGIDSPGLKRLRFPEIPAESFPYTFPIDFGDTIPSTVTGRQFLLEFHLNSNDSTKTPEILSWAVQAAVKFNLREIITLSFHVKDHIQNRRGAKSKYTAADIHHHVRTLRDAIDTTIGYEDYRGYKFANVRILPGFGEIDNQDEARGPSETVMTLRLMKISED